MKRQQIAKCAIAASLLAGGCFGVFAANKPGYVVKPSAIVPEWSGAEPGVWTMDYASALANANAEGKWTLMQYSGMWWCPHCQALEERVLTQPAFSNYVAECGYYLTVLDSPYRDGYSNWCWLYETNYVENVAHLTMEEALQEIDNRYAVQESYALPGATEYNIASWDGTTNIVYHKVGYPTIIVIRPDGRPAGRFSFSRNTASDVALAYVTNLIEQIKRYDDWDERDNYWQTTETTLAPSDEPGEIVLHGDHVLGTNDKADWFKIEASDSAARWTFLFDQVEDMPCEPVSAMVYGDPGAAPLAVADIDFKSMASFSVEFPEVGVYYLKVSASNLNEVVGYSLSYILGNGRTIEFGAPETLIKTGMEQAMPTLRDVDGDGLLDVLVGVKEPLSSDRGVLTGYVGRVRIYRNMGTAEAPRYGGYSYLSANGAVLEDVLEKNSGCQGLKVEFGDFDGDGYDDLFVGYHWGELDVHWGTSEPDVYSEPTRIYDPAGDMNGYRAYPCAHDLDGDGRVELYLGCIGGTFTVFTCDQERNVVNLGAIDDGAGNLLKVSAARSTPALADVDGDGILDIMSGDTNGNILYFPATGVGKWSSKPETLATGKTGTRSRIAAADLDGDGNVDVVVGYANGTVALMSGAPRSELVCEPNPDGYVPGLAIDPIAVTLDPPMASATISAKGLPSGLSLKQDKKSGAYQIEGTPSRPGTNNVTLNLSYTLEGIRKARATNVQIVVLPLPELVIDMDCMDGSTGRVSGAGAYLAGKKVSISATPDTRTKSVFAGWYVGDQPFEGGGADYRTQKLQFAVPSNAVTRLTARFSPAAEDASVSVYLPDQTLRAGVNMGEVPVQTYSLSLPTVSAKGLPAGVKFDAKTLVLSGVPTKPGEYDVVFTAKNVSKESAECTAHITVLNFASDEIGPLEERYFFTAGVVVGEAIFVEGCSVSGLPPGIAFDKDSGMIYGTPTTPGTWLVTFSKKVGKSNATASSWFYVAGAGDAIDGTDGIPVTAAMLSGDDETVVTNGAWSIDLVQGVSWNCRIGSAPTLFPSPVTYSVKGLPTGLKFDAKTGVISGAPTKVSAVDSRTKAVKPALVTVAAANKAKWKGSLQLEIYVNARPAWAAGTYDGVASFGGTNGLFTATVAETGSTSGKYTIGGKSYSFKAASLAGENEDGSFYFDAEIALSRSSIVTNRLVLGASVYESAEVTGIAEDMLIGRMLPDGYDAEDGFQVTNCYQNLWLRKDAASYRLPVFASGAQKSLSVSRGNLLFRFSAKGKVSVAGKLDGKSVSGSAQLIATDFGIPSCYCDPTFYYNGLVPVALPRQDYFSTVTFMGSSGVEKITGKDENFDLTLSSEDQTVE